jgi:ABC-2 type transport system ATP-binding protein
MMHTTEASSTAQSPAHTGALLEVRGLSHVFGAVRALDDLSFMLHSGSVLGLIGPNGAGKSTALACVAGLVQPQQGQVRLFGAAASAHTRRRHTFFLPDGIAPWEDQRTAWVLDFASRVYGATESWRESLAPALAIESLVAQRIGDLSKGQRKRVLLALALLVPRPLTLIDEPFEGLDPRQARAFTAVVRTRAATGRTFVLSIHSASDAMRTCDAHLLLHEGRALAQGDLPTLRAVAQVSDDAGLEEVFLALT